MRLCRDKFQLCLVLCIALFNSANIPSCVLKWCRNDTDMKKSGITFIRESKCQRSMYQNLNMKSTCGWAPHNTQVCEHCRIPFVENTWICREGYSYHQECHKCYCCGESDLRDSETFNGVIFCSACSQRIFHNGSAIVKTNQYSYVYEDPAKSSSEEKIIARGTWSTRVHESIPHRGRVSKRSNRVKQRPASAQDRELNNQGPYEVPDMPEVPVGRPWPLGHCARKIRTSMQIDKQNSVHDSEQVLKIHDMTKKSLATSTDRVTIPKPYVAYTRKTPHSSSEHINKYTICMSCTNKSTCCSFDLVSRSNKATQDVTSRANKCVQCIKRLQCAKETPPKWCDSVKRLSRSSMHRKDRKRQHKSKKVDVGKVKSMDCYDLRMEALGTSTEIANQALLDVEAQASDSTVFQRCSMPKERPNSDTLPSRRRQSDLALIDRRVRSIIKLPFRSFKKNIIDRSSLIDAVMYCGDQEERPSNIMNNLRTVFLESNTPLYHARGVKKLYKTIHRKQEAHRLGWPPVSENDAYALNSVMRCSHYHKSYSYRCMRKHTMKLAGPTSDQLSLMLESAKDLITPRLLVEFVNLLKKNLRLNNPEQSRPRVRPVMTNAIILSRQSQMKNVLNNNPKQSRPRVRPVMTNAIILSRQNQMKNVLISNQRFDK